MTPSAAQSTSVLRALRAPTALALYAALIAGWLGWLQPFELRLLDWRAALSRHIVDSDLVLIEIDAQSLQRLHTWPWPRRYHARLLEALRAAGVADVFYDVDFSAKSTAEDDRLLANALAAYPPGGVMLPAFVQPANSMGKGGMVAIAPLPELRERSALVSVIVRPDDDGLIRRVPTTWHIGDEMIVPAGVRMIGGSLPPQRSVDIDYSIHPDSFLRGSFADVLDGRYDPAALRGKHVIVGATAIELGDILPVPVYHALPGSVVQALAYQTLRGGGLRAASGAIDLFVLVLLAPIMGAVFRRSSWRGALLSVAAGVVSVFAASVYAYREWQLVVATAAPIAQLVLGYGFLLVACVERQHLQLVVQAFDLRRKDTLMSGVVDHSIDGILTVTSRGVITSVNPAAVKLFEADAALLIGQHVGALIPGLESAQADGDALGAIVGAAGCTTERDCRRADGGLFPAEIAVSRMALDGGLLYTVFVRDITERARQREALEHQATHDALTGLANRHLLNYRLHRVLSAADRDAAGVALLLVDLDKFKEINDALGHAVGDRLLVQVAKRFRTCVDDRMVLARIGGDEFAVMIPGLASPRDGVATAERLIESLKQPFTVRDMALEIDASIGIAHFPDHATDGIALLQNADAAMYAAKRSGTGVALYQPELTAKNNIRMAISTGLRQAMADNRLSMYYQPKLDLKTHSVVGAEALLRWQHPQLGFVPPDDIIDVAENTGLIWPLTEWTLKHALSETAVWHDKGYPIRISVNLSARLLQDPTLYERILRCLGNCAIDPQWLTLEITESAIMSDPNRALKNAAALQAAGIALSIDDFGTGYSSLSYLRSLPVAELKIDKSFVLDMLNSGNDTVIVKSTIDLAHNLGLKVVAKGVESAPILEALRDLGCDIAQGYHISRPVTRESMESWLQERWGNELTKRRSAG